nr:unnamed protein product [Digitaria exilis]
MQASGAPGDDDWRPHAEAAGMGYDAGTRDQEASDGLDDTLREAYVLIVSCQNCSIMYRFFMGWKQAEQFREVQKKIDGLPVFRLSELRAATNNFSSENLIGCGGFGKVYKAWKMWTAGRSLELVDPLQRDEPRIAEILRCIQIALLCVEPRQDDRPNMRDVILMLSCDSLRIPSPKRRGYESPQIAPAPPCSKEQITDGAQSLDAH